MNDLQFPRGAVINGQKYDEYCSCQTFKNDYVVKCGGPDCIYEWFHFTCVGIQEHPKGLWFCGPPCRLEWARRRFDRPLSPVSSEASVDSELKEDDEWSDVDGGLNWENVEDDDPCICVSPRIGPMIGCDGPRCRNKWFHFECVGLRNDYVGKWYCGDACRQDAENTDTEESAAEESEVEDEDEDDEETVMY